MKVVLVVDIAYEAGGAEKSVQLIRNELRARGHKVLVLSTTKHADGQKVFADELIPVIAGGGLTRLGKHFWYATSYKKAREILRDFQPELIHLHTIGEFSPSLLWGFGRIPMILTVHGPEEFTKKLLPWLLPASDYRSGSYQWRDITPAGRLRHAYYRYLQRPAYRVALRRLKLVIAPSKFMAADIAGDFPHTPITQIYNGIELLPAAALPASSNLLYVGRLEAVKGVRHLVNAFADVHRKLPSARLRIVGDGTQRAELEGLTKELGLSSSVDFAGWIAQERIGKEFAAAQVLVIPSVWPENLPTVAIEALAVGRPIVGTDTGGIKELVDDGVNGHIVKAGDEAALARTLTQLLGDADELQRAAKASVRKSQEFGVTMFMEKLLTVYKEALHENITR